MILNLPTLYDHKPLNFIIWGIFPWGDFWGLIQLSLFLGWVAQALIVPTLQDTLWLCQNSY